MLARLVVIFLLSSACLVQVESAYCQAPLKPEGSYIDPSACFSPLLQAHLDYKGHDSYRLAYLSTVSKEQFSQFKGTDFLKGLFLDAPVGVENDFGVFQSNQAKEISTLNLTVEQEKERSLSILQLDPQAAGIIHDCLTGGLGLHYTAWSTNPHTTILQFNWRGQGNIPLTILSSHLENAKSASSQKGTTLFDGPKIIKDSLTVTLRREDPNAEITVAFETSPPIQYLPPIIRPFPWGQKCISKTYDADPVTGAPYTFNQHFNVNEERWLRRNVPSPLYGTDWFISFSPPPPGVKLFTDQGIVVVTSATCSKGNQQFIDIVGGSPASANGINSSTVTCEGGKNGQPGDIYMSGSYAVTAQVCEVVPWGK